MAVSRLKYCLVGANISGNFKHAQEVMRELGITYQVSVPQSISDSWDFWNCENVPDDLPSWIKPMPIDPMSVIGWGLSEEKAILIRDYTPATQNINKE